jgi:hypothetical protein
MRLNWMLSIGDHCQHFGKCSSPAIPAGFAQHGERKAIVKAEDWEGPDFQTCMDAPRLLPEV